MAPQRKRDNRENAFFNVGVQGRKTGITLEERARDEHGIEAISGIFSSPEKSPPKRGSTVTGSESMDIQESSIPNITTSAAILRNNRTHLPPPRSRSPMKTALGSSPRRQSSMAPRGSSIGLSSPIRATSHSAVARRLDFQEEEESSLQETPALSGSGQRRERRDIYALSRSPSRPHSAIMEESELQEQINANNEEEDELPIMTEIEESFVGQIGDDTVTGADAVESLLQEDTQVEEEEAPAPVKEPAKRGRKRKSDQVAPIEEESPKPPKSRKRGTGAAQAPEPASRGKKAAPAAPARRSKRVSDITEQEPSIVESEPAQEAPVAPKRRGRPPKVQKDDSAEAAAPAKANKKAATKPVGKEKEKEKEKEEPIFKKPGRPLAKPKAKPVPKGKENTGATNNISKDEAGRPVDAYGNPLSKADIEQMSTTSVGSRYGRGRHLSVFREMEPDAIARVGRTGRHRVAPIDFWKNDRINYNHDGSMATIVKAPSPEPARPSATSSKKGTKKKSTAIPIDDDEVDLDPWEEEPGVLAGNYKDFDPANEFSSPGLVEGVIAWSTHGIRPEPVGDGSFQYARVGGSGPSGFFNWGVIELRADQMKRSKNSRRMHMVFHVLSGALEVKVHENEFAVHKGGIWQVPRGNTYSIRNVGAKTARVFFAQAREAVPEEE
ncbi:hypothetical protein E8E13_001849 [Curvularia kusanoi]|uniref:CENP-C homolog n=1 Tax=Curvularia kusanoi TaxID=90978 RepID=A0A9P4TFW6_CURKU|nr:hypothetical protein E8E13_001849 [Curvularia kusanoi]